VIVAAMVIGSLTVLLVMKAGGGRASTDAAVARQGSDAADAAGPVITPIDAEAAPAEDAQEIAVAADAAVEIQIDAAPVAPVESQKTPLESAMEERRYADAVAICTKRLTGETAADCTLAACHVRVEAKARAWFPRTAAGERQRLIGLCRSLGIDPVPPRRPPPMGRPDAGVVDKCELNPMACQH
jgi:hypothetical protein